MQRVDSQPRRSGRQRFRWAAVWMALVYLAAALGALPSPRLLGELGFATSSGSRERFPCEGCLCGCATAEQCWDDCCCHSLEERWAWAKANGVTPPPKFLAKVEAAGLTAEPEAGSCALCHAGEPESPTRLIPTLSPLSCKGLSPWIALGAIVAMMADSPIERVTLSWPALPVADAAAPEWVCLESPTPPPRA